MAIKVIAGDIEEGQWDFHWKTWKYPWTIRRLTNKAARERGPTAWEEYDLREHLRTAQQLDEESARSLAGAAGWGFVGGLALGPLGLVGGALFGGRQKKTEVTVAFEFHDGTRFLATCKPEVWKRLRALVWDKERIVDGGTTS